MNNKQETENMGRKGDDENTMRAKSLPYTCSNCLTEYMCYLHVSTQSIEGATRKAYTCDQCEQLYARKSRISPINASTPGLIRRGSESFFAHTLTPEEHLRLENLFPEEWDEYDEMMSKHASILEVLYASDASYNLKRAVTLSWFTMFDICVRWGYENLSGLSLRFLVEGSFPKKELLCDIDKNPYWTWEIASVVLKTYGLNQDVKTYLLSKLPDSFYTEETIEAMIEALPKMRLENTDRLFEQARRVFKFDESLPLSWVAKTLGANPL